MVPFFFFFFFFLPVIIHSLLLPSFPPSSFLPPSHCFPIVWPCLTISWSSSSPHIAYAEGLYKGFWSNGICGESMESLPVSRFVSFFARSSYVIAIVSKKPPLFLCLYIYLFSCFCPAQSNPHPSFNLSNTPRPWPQRYCAICRIQHNQKQTPKTTTGQKDHRRPALEDSRITRQNAFSSSTTHKTGTSS